MIRRPPRSPLFPSTPLSRSQGGAPLGLEHPPERGLRHAARPPSSFPPPSTSTKSRTCAPPVRDRKSTRLNSSHGYISYAVFCLKKKKQTNAPHSVYRGVTSP